MIIHLNWRKKFLSRKHAIFYSGQEIGHVSRKTYSRKSRAEINTRKYTIVSKGTLNSRVIVFDNDAQKVVGWIRVNFWKAKANIETLDKVVLWRFYNFRHIRWNITDDENTHVTSTNYAFQGEMELMTNDYLLLIIGLFLSRRTYPPILRFWV